MVDVTLSLDLVLAMFPLKIGGFYFVVVVLHVFKVVLPLLTLALLVHSIW